MKNLNGDSNRDPNGKDMLSKAIVTIVGAAITVATSWAVGKVKKYVPEALDKAEEKAKELHRCHEDKKRVQLSFQSGYTEGRFRRIGDLKRAMRDFGIQQELVESLQLPYWKVFPSLSYEQIKSENIDDLVVRMYRRGEEWGASQVDEEIVKWLRLNGFEESQIDRIRLAAS